MSGASPITRRRLGQVLVSLLTMMASRARGEETEPPTQVDPAARKVKEKALRDRGIGGTGVIGTIRGFGSIVVNNIHIAYPDHVSVSIDGRRARASSLRLGQVVQVLAHADRERLVALHIEVTSEVVGPVQFLDGPEMVVMGQKIHIAPGMGTAKLRTGDVIAVFGLRRLDGAIVASRIERRPGAPLRVAGPLAIDARGQLHIGGLIIQGGNPRWVGTRIIATGHLAANGLQVASSRQDLDLLEDPHLSRIILESYVEHSLSWISFGFGFQLPAADARIHLRELGGAPVIATLGRRAEGGLELNAASADRNGPSPGASPPSSPPQAPSPQMPGNPPGPNMPNGPSGPGGGPSSGGPSNSNGPPSNH